LRTTDGLLTAPPRGQKDGKAMKTYKVWQDKRGYLRDKDGSYITSDGEILKMSVWQYKEFKAARDTSECLCNHKGIAHEDGWNQCLYADNCMCGQFKAKEPK
jgi:hypothetical protein